MRQNKRIRLLIDSGVPFRGGLCLDCYNRQWHDGWHITITARYDDGNKFVTQAVETEWWCNHRLWKGRLYLGKKAFSWRYDCKDVLAVLKQSWHSIHNICAKDTTSGNLWWNGIRRESSYFQIHVVRMGSSWFPTDTHPRWKAVTTRTRWLSFWYMKRSSKVTLRIPQATKTGYIECPVWGCFDWNYPKSELRRGRVQGGAIFALRLQVVRW